MALAEDLTEGFQMSWRTELRSNRVLFGRA